MAETNMPVDREGFTCYGKGLTVTVTIFFLLAWLSIIASKRMSVQEILKEFWKKYGRGFFVRCIYTIFNLNCIFFLLIIYFFFNYLQIKKFIINYYLNIYCVSISNAVL